MGEKSVQKRKYIIQTARKVFEEKGYLKVTMKDIVDACQISRGGLYLYYESIKELFLDVLKEEKETAEDSFGPAISGGMASADVLGLFLTEQKKEILKGRKSLVIAIYEYYFENEMPKKENDCRNQFFMAIKVVEKLIRAGVREGDFYCADPLGAARNMMFVLEGMKLAAVTMSLSEEEVNREILYLLKNLMTDRDA